MTLIRLQFGNPGPSALEEMKTEGREYPDQLLLGEIPPAVGSTSKLALSNFLLAFVLRNLAV